MINFKKQGSGFHLLLAGLLAMGGVVLVKAQTVQTYWASPNGTATWANARSATPLAGTSACSLATANANTAAGDSVILRGGMYSNPIQPAHSGTGSAARIIYQAHGGETPVISQSGNLDTNFIAIWLDNRSYIRITGIRFEHVGRWMLLSRGSSYNEISHCQFNPPALISLRIYRTDGAACTHNWFHHNTVYGQGYVSDAWDDEGNLMQIGEQGSDGTSSNNTVEDNVFYHGGHHCLETFTQFNIVRNNHMHNECWMSPPANPVGPAPQIPCSNGLYGNRCFTLDAQFNSGQDGQYNLAEGNRFGHAGRPPDDDGADNVELASHKNIFRYNYIFNAAKDGLYFRDGAFGSVFASNNRVYHNTIYANGINEAGSYNSLYRRSGIFFRTQCSGNVIKNNISYNNYNRDIYSGYPIGLYGNTVENNWLTSAAKNDPIYVSAGLLGDPKFIDTNISDPFNQNLPDLKLQADSPCIDRGSNLTTANNHGNNSITLMVADALYFQDGTWGSILSGVKADWIAIGPVANVVQISSINYSTNAITLAAPLTWNANAPVWLYKDSTGRTVLFGAAPDIGAHELTSWDQNFSLAAGWNWISFNQLPADFSLDAVFSTILSPVEQVKGQTQSAIRSGSNWKGDLADMSGIGSYKMFKVKVTQACTLTVTGSAISPTTPIPLQAGWNWVAYLPTTAMPIATALASINGQVQEVKSLTQSSTYSGGAWSGTLTQLNPGQGYAIKMSTLGILTYPAAASIKK
jgi:hypothetical protein